MELILTRRIDTLITDKKSWSDFVLLSNYLDKKKDKGDSAITADAPDMSIETEKRLVMQQ